MAVDDSHFSIGKELESFLHDCVHVIINSILEEMFAWYCCNIGTGEDYVLTPSPNNKRLSTLKDLT